MGQSLSKEVLDQIILDAKADADNPLRQGVPTVLSEDGVIDDAAWEDDGEHVCDENCQHPQISPVVMRILRDRARRLANQQKRGGKKKRR